MELMRQDGTLSPKEKMVHTYIVNNPGCKSGEIAEKLNISKPTVKRIVSDLISKHLIFKFGQGAGTNYRAEG
jgi:DNA-binding MarR family transcriptional regulator